MRNDINYQKHNALLSLFKRLLNFRSLNDILEVFIEFQLNSINLLILNSKYYQYLYSHL